MSSHVHLAELDPRRVAEHVARAVLARARRDARWLGMVVKVTPPPAAGTDPKAAVSTALGCSQVMKVARMCADWATGGKGEPEEVAVALRELRAMIEGVEPGVGVPGEVRELTPAAKVLVAAAEARLALAAGRTVQAVEIAVLASVDERSIRAATQAGALQPVGTGRPMRFEAIAVRRYLYERGVAGFAAG
jgi:hypothetical protein